MVKRIEYKTGDLVILHDPNYSNSERKEIPLLCSVVQVFEYVNTLEVAPFDKKLFSKTRSVSYGEVSPFYFPRDHLIKDMDTGVAFEIVKITSSLGDFKFKLKKPGIFFKLKSQYGSREVEYSELIRNYSL